MWTVDRDRQIVQSVARFGQLATAHIASLHFAEAKSHTNMKLALQRLVNQKHLARIERRLVGGSGAGSGQYVYQLGSAGWRASGREGRYWPYRAVNYHTLAIADVYSELLSLQREGRIEIQGFTTEPESWTHIAGVDLRPDLFIEVEQKWNTQRLALWIEVDMGTERQKQIKEKLASYWHAYENAPESMSVFPRVLFLAPDDHRAKELRYIVEQGNEDAQALFFISTMASFTGVLFG